MTGVAGFIGSSLAEALLGAGQTVVGLDNLTTGKTENVRLLQSLGGARFQLVEGDIRDANVCLAAAEGVEVILHQAAQVSVPASMTDPVTTHEVNTTGFLNVLLAAREHRVRRVVYASSCAVYGDSTALPLSEDQPAQPLSPYAVTKYVNELYASVFARSYGLASAKKLSFNEPVHAAVRADGCELVDPGSAHQVLGHLDGWGRGLFTGNNLPAHQRTRGSSNAAVATYLVRGTGALHLRVGAVRIGFLDEVVAV